MFQPISKMINLSDRDVMRTIVLPVVVAAVALAIAFIGAIIIGSDSGIDEVNLFVERLSATLEGGWAALWERRPCLRWRREWPRRSIPAVSRCCRPT